MLEFITIKAVPVIEVRNKTLKIFRGSIKTTETIIANQNIPFLYHVFTNQ